MKKSIFKYVLLCFLIIALIFVSCSNQDNLAKKNYELKYPENINIVFQKDWGGTENQTTNEPHIIDRITLHHGGVEFTSDKDPVEYMKNLQSWSRSEKKWMDIPYHFLIDLNGATYEGRSLEYPGDTNTTYDPTGHLLICLMGNYEIQTVNAVQLKSIVNLISFFCNKFNIDVELIKSHKDYTETACPGKDLYSYLENGSIVKAVSTNLYSNILEDK